VRYFAYVGAMIPDFRKKKYFDHLQFEITLQRLACSSKTLASGKHKLTSLKNTNVDVLLHIVYSMIRPKNLCHLQDTLYLWIFGFINVTVVTAGVTQI
jgi:hypothetical protein